MIYWLIIVTVFMFVLCCNFSVNKKNATWWIMPLLISPMIWAIVKLWNV